MIHEVETTDGRDPSEAEALSPENREPGRDSGRPNEAKDLPEAEPASESRGHFDGAHGAVGSREEGTARGARATVATSDADRDASQRKERVLHTRVPAVLEAELKRFADSLRVPVSNLVRTILEDALSVADAASESVEARLKLAAHQLEFERERLKRRVVPDPLKDVFAFQPVTLAQTCFCAKCSERLAPGTSAHMGLVDSPSGNPRPRIFVCDSCLPKS